MSKIKVFAEEMFNYAKFPEIEKIKLLEAENALLRKAVSAASMFCRDTSSPARLDKLRDALSELEQEGRNCKS